MKDELFFRTTLLAWHKTNNARQLPWKNESDPYKIWLSEIMLQQTRAEAVIPFYEKFLAHFPQISDLANANEQHVFKLWEGLGYYNRCRNLITTAKAIVQEHGGIFPSDYKQILALKGVGVYTAAAIASFAYEQAYAVVDGNVYRILARFFHIEKPIDNAEGKSFFQTLAQRLLHLQKAKLYNQAIMDFGATVCTPKQPHCHSCVFQQRCISFQKGLVLNFPVKLKKTKVIKRQMAYLMIQYKNKIFIQQRKENDIWKNLYEFVPYEGTKKELYEYISTHFDLNKSDIQQQIFTQQLTHQELTITILFFQIQHIPAILTTNFVAVPITKLNTFAFPKALREAILWAFSKKKNIGIK